MDFVLVVIVVGFYTLFSCTNFADFFKILSFFHHFCANATELILLCCCGDQFFYLFYLSILSVEKRSYFLYQEHKNL